MEIIRASVDNLFKEFGYSGAGSPFSGEISNLLFAWNFTSKKEPEKTWKLSAKKKPNCPSDRTFG